MTPSPVTDLGGFLKDQRQQAQLSLRQLADRSGISNPYLSQIERGLRKPSGEILQALAKGLQISAEQLYVHAGLLDANLDGSVGPAKNADGDVRTAIRADSQLTDRQRALLLDLYASFVDDEPASTH